MKVFRISLLFCLVTVNLAAYGQPAFDSVRFFLDEKPLAFTLSTDLGNLMSGKIKDTYQKATFTCQLSGNSILSEDIRLSARGHMRRAICVMPPIRLSFRNATSPKLSCLNSLKLVTSCKKGDFHGQLLLKEYLIYKIYNFITEKSFRVRLVNITYEDSKDKKKPFTQYGFFVENVDALAKRNKRKEGNNMKVSSNDIDRAQMTMVDIFEYMIGNTDWSVPNNHNIKLLISKKDSTLKPHAVPYDFDYAGLVNADYASPDPIMKTESVLERVYRGYPRTMSELQAVLKVYIQQKENIYTLIQNFEPLDGRNKKEVLYYLDEFYKSINNPNNKAAKTAYTIKSAISLFPRMLERPGRRPAIKPIQAAANI